MYKILVILYSPSLHYKDMTSLHLLIYLYTYFLYIRHMLYGSHRFCWTCHPDLGFEFVPHWALCDAPHCSWVGRAKGMQPQSRIPTGGGLYDSQLKYEKRWFPRTRDGQCGTCMGSLYIPRRIPGKLTSPLKKSGCPVTWEYSWN